MAKPKRTSDDYVQLKKKIIDKDIRGVIRLLMAEWKMTDQEVCYEFIRRQAIIEIQKKKP